MTRAGQVAAAHSVVGEVASEVVLDYDARHRRRRVLTDSTGAEFLLDLPKATHLRNGDALLLDDGRRVRVRAAPEALLEVRAHDVHHLLRLAWHIGNRHLAAELADGCIYLRDDHVIAAMLEGLGATVTTVQRPFDPESGAYASAGHSHGRSGT